MELVIVLVLIAALGGCSNSKKKSQDASSKQQTIVESTEDKDFVVDADEDESSFVVVNEAKESQPSEKPASENTPTSKLPEVSSGDWESYKAEKGDTLMLIAFKIYGDYRLWRKIAKANNKKQQRVAEGEVLKYEAPEEKFEWEPNGDPYLVQNGDTLGTISKDKYGTSKRWKEIWKNNQPLIVDPNLIFSGFTIYCLKERELASK